MSCSPSQTPLGGGQEGACPPKCKFDGTYDKCVPAAKVGAEFNELSYAKGVLKNNVFQSSEKDYYMGKTGKNPHGIDDKVWAQAVQELEPQTLDEGSVVFLEKGTTEASAAKARISIATIKAKMADIQSPDQVPDKAQLAKEYKELIGYDPFEDDPNIAVEEVSQTLKEYKEDRVKEAAVSKDMEQEFDKYYNAAVKELGEDATTDALIAYVLGNLLGDDETGRGDTVRDLSRPQRYTKLIDVLSEYFTNKALGKTSGKEDIYIIYDPVSYKFIKSFDWFGQAEDFAKANNYAVLNRTHPKNKELLEKIKADDTNTEGNLDAEGAAIVSAFGKQFDVSKYEDKFLFSDAGKYTIGVGRIDSLDTEEYAVTADKDTYAFKRIASKEKTLHLYAGLVKADMVELPDGSGFFTATIPTKKDSGVENPGDVNIENPDKSPYQSKTAEDTDPEQAMKFINEVTKYDSIDDLDMWYAELSKRPEWDKLSGDEMQQVMNAIKMQEKKLASKKTARHIMKTAALSQDTLDSVPSKRDTETSLKDWTMYDNKAVKDWTVDDFATYAWDQTTPDGDIEPNTPVLSEMFPEGHLPKEPTGANNDDNWNLYKSEKSVLYDIAVDTWGAKTAATKTARRSMKEMEEFLAQKNEEDGTAFELQGAYGNYELWSKGNRIETGSLEDIYQAWIKNRFKDEYRKEATKKTAEDTDMSDLVQSTVAQYGWTSNKTADGFELFNRNDKKVVIVKVKGNRYQMFDTINNKLMSGNGQIAKSLEKLLTKYYYAQKTTEANKTAATSNEILKKDYLEEIQSLEGQIAYAKEQIEGIGEAPDQQWETKEYEAVISDNQARIAEIKQTLENMTAIGSKSNKTFITRSQRPNQELNESIGITKNSKNSNISEKSVKYARNDAVYYITHDKQKVEATVLGHNNNQHTGQYTGHQYTIRTQYGIVTAHHNELRKKAVR